MKGKSSFTEAEADAIIELIKLKADVVQQKNIRNKIRALGFYASDFGIGGGYTVEDFLRVVTIIGQPKTNKSISTKSFERIISKAPAKRLNSDESYVIDLCDEVLKTKAVRQAKFNFLRGDAGTMLPCDAYYSSLNLVIEYREKQHTEEVKFFDKRETVSGVGRGEQRRLYDQRRRDVLPQNGITLIEFGYKEFIHEKSKRLIRNREQDIQVVKTKLKKFIKK